VLLFCVSQCDITLVHESTLLVRRSNFYPILSTESNVHVSCLFYSPKHTNCLSRATGPSVTSSLAAEITCFVLCLSELAVGKELLHGAELFLRGLPDCSWSGNSSHFMESEGSLAHHSHVRATCHYPEPAQSSTYSIPLSEDPA